MRDLRIVLSALALCFIGSWPALAASDAACRDYAQSAVHQYNEAVALGVPNVGPPVWSNGYNGHYTWCLKANEATLRAETEKREQVLASYRSRQHEATMQEPTPQTAGATATIQGPYKRISGDCVDISRLTADPSLSNAVERMTYIEAAIITAGEAEQKVAALPLPLPYPVNGLAPEFQKIARDLIALRSSAYRNDSASATRMKSALSAEAGEIVQYLAGQNAALPIPLPRPLVELTEVSMKLQKQIAATPVSLPASGQSATPINIPIVRQ